MRDPKSALQPPEAEQAFPAPLDEVLSAGAWLNLSHWIMKAIELVSDVNPGQWVVDQFTGDWQAFAKAGDACQKLGHFYELYGKAIDDGENQLFKTWEGNAADQAKSYFNKLSEAVAAEDSSIEHVGKEMKTVAFGVWGVAKTLDVFLRRCSIT